MENKVTSQKSSVDESEHNNLGPFKYPGLDSLQGIVGFIISASVLASAFGFFIVNNYLDNFGAIQGYSVVSGRFIAAAIWFLPVLIIMATFVVTGFLSKNLVGWYFGALLLGAVILQIIFDYTIPDNQTDPVEYAIYATILLMTFITLFVFSGALIGKEFGKFESHHLVRQAFSILGAIIWGFVIVWISSDMFSKVIYPGIPQSWGGGQLISAVLILYPEDADALPLELAPGSTDTTKPLWILSELNNGYLVHDEDTNLTLIVKHESIRAIIDAGEQTYTPQPTLIPSATPSVTATP